MAEAVVTILNNGRLMKPQKFDGSTLKDWTDSTSVFGATQKTYPLEMSTEDWTKFEAKNGKKYEENIVRKSFPVKNK